MFRRQQVILALVDQAGGTLSRLALVKYVFLLRQETAFRNAPSFYDFLPYKYGPFSFVLYHDVERLHRDGYLRMGEKWIDLDAHGRELAGGARLPPSERNAVRAVVTKYGEMCPSALVRNVYRRYPWYASRSHLTRRSPQHAFQRARATPAVYTAGYEGRSVDAFLNSLLKAGIQAILDVRANPVSRKYGFAKSRLSAIAASLDVYYRHLPELGIPSRLRSGLADHASYERVFDRYEAKTLAGHPEQLKQLIQLLRQRPSALVCMEADAARCHRGRLASAASRLSSLPVVHL